MRSLWLDLRENGRLPSYITSRTFALALLEIIAPASPEGSYQIADLRKAVAQLPESWDVRGGPGTIRYYAPKKALIVRQSAEVHVSLKASLSK